MHLANSSFHLPAWTLPLGLAPRMAKFTFAFRPSIMGLGSRQALSAEDLSPIITCKQRQTVIAVVNAITRISI